MSDTEILNWVEMNVTSVFCDINETFKITWLDEDGFNKETYGENLRNAVINAQQT